MLVADLQKDPATKADSASMTIGALCVAYIGHCRGYYLKNGKETSEVGCVQQALRPLVALHAKTLVSEFSPLKLQQVRDEMIQRGWVRTSINRHILRIRKMFKWGVATEAIPSSSVIDRLKTVDGLRKGRTKATEPDPVTAVSRADVEAIRGHIRPVVWSMIRMQLATGMRPGEVRVMRLCDIDRSGDVWEYRPTVHKLEHKDISRVIFLGKEAQAIVNEYASSDDDRPLFEASPGKTYTKDGYCRAVSRACKQAGITPWSPNQLRHTAATEIRKRFGIEASRVILGHASTVTTEVYAERDLEAARKIIDQIG
jgi:integrase